MVIFRAGYFFILENQYNNELLVYCFFMWLHGASSCNDLKNFRFIRKAVECTSYIFLLTSFGSDLISKNFKEAILIPVQLQHNSFKAL